MGWPRPYLNQAWSQPSSLSWTVCGPAAYSCGRCMLRTALSHVVCTHQSPGLQPSGDSVQQLLAFVSFHPRLSPLPVEDVKCFPVASRLEKEGQLLPRRSLVLILCDWMGPSPKARSLDGLATALVPVPFSSPWRSGCQAGVLTSAITSARQSHPVALGGLIA